MAAPRSIVLPACGLLAASAFLYAAPPDQPSPETVQRNAETFDAVWTTIESTHWDPTLNGLDWPAVRTELLPKAKQAKNAAELRAIIGQMISRLGQSHFAILPGEDMLEAEPAPQSPAAVPADAPNAPPAKPTRARKRDAEPGVTGATLTLLPAPKSDSAAASPPAWEAVITHIAPDSEAAKAQLLPGTVVLAVDGKSILRDLPQGEGLERYEREAIIDARGTGAPHSKSTWRVRTPDGKERDVELRFAADARPTTKFGNLPPIHCSLSWTELDPLVLQRHEAGEARIGAITFDSWFMPVAKPFDQAVDKLRQADGIILDLRGNPGGFGGMAMGIAGHFTPNAETLGSMIMRDSTLNFVTNPRLVSADGKPVNVFEGPVAILVDTGTASTSEIFAGGMQHLTRARIFGSRTAGAALPAIFEELPNGDVFLHAIADFRLPDGRALEAAGVKPDHQRTYTSQDYAREGDPVLADAVRWIAAERAKRAKNAANVTTRTQEKTP